MLSSEAMQSDFARFAPGHAAKARVARFPSSVAFDDVSSEPQGVLRRYGIPSRFILVVNQFWRHKNHLLVVEALRIAASAGVRIPLVMVGTPADYRDPRNETVSKVLQAAAAGGVREHVWVLGEVPRADLVDLLRCTSLLVQPSRSEGWSTSVQDARALGRPVACADIDVLREQAPDSVGFFDPDDAETLATILCDFWASGPEPVGSVSEREALAREMDAVREYGRRLAAMCHEVLT